MSWIETMKRSSKSFREHMENGGGGILIVDVTYNAGDYLTSITYDEIVKSFHAGKQLYFRSAEKAFLYPIIGVNINNVNHYDIIEFQIVAITNSKYYIGEVYHRSDSEYMGVVFPDIPEG